MEKVLMLRGGGLPRLIVYPSSDERNLHISYFSGAAEIVLGRNELTALIDYAVEIGFVEPLRLRVSDEVREALAAGEAAAEGLRQGLGVLPPWALTPEQWAELDPKWICAAVDADGQRCVFANKPRLGQSVWWPTGRTPFHNVDEIDVIDLSVDWTQTLTWRPGHEPQADA